MAKTVLNKLLALAVQNEASDIHLKVDGPAVFRVGNDLVDTSYIPDAAALQQFFEQITQEEHRQKFHDVGDVDVSLLEEDVGRFRVNLHRQRGTLAVNLRHVKNTVRSFEDLGLPNTLGRIAETPRGIIFVTGTTGSGKSTTLAAMMEYVNQHFRRHIITIEDPIEYEFKDNMSIFDQREVGIDTASFASALVHALRQDPDIILVGEMRDRASFEAALQAADTGHLVLTTLHATNSTQSITRVLDFYQKDEQDSIREALANNLAAIISQRLITRAMGSGRVPAWEIMLNTPVITKLIQDNRLDKLPAAIMGGDSDGMISFNMSLLQLVNDGIITEEDALEASDNPDSLRMNFEGIFLSADSGGIIGDRSL